MPTDNRKVVMMGQYWFVYLLKGVLYVLDGILFYFVLFAIFSYGFGVGAWINYLLCFVIFGAIRYLFFVYLAKAERTQKT